MRYHTNLAILAAATLFLASKAGAQPKPPVAEKPPNPKLEKTRMPPELPLPGDPAVKTALSYMGAVKDREKKVAELLQKIAANSTLLRPGVINLKAEKKVWDKLKELLPVLRDEGNGLVRDYDDFLREHQLLQVTYTKAADSCLAAASDFEKHALEPDLEEEERDNYVTAAKLVKNKAIQLQKLASNAKQDRAKIGKDIRYIRRGLVYLQRLEPLLEIVSTAVDQGEEVQKYIDRVGRFVDSFRKTVRQLKEIGDRLDPYGKTPVPVSRMPADQLYRLGLQAVINHRFYRAKHLFAAALANHPANDDAAWQYASMLRYCDLVN